MALVDVTDLLTDPDFIDAMSIISRVAVINTYGENSVTESTVNTFGSIQPISGKDLLRLPESLREKNVSTFWVKGQIKGTACDAYPDILVFKCKRYQVQQIMDWMNFGQGWTQGVAIVETPV